MGILNWLKHVTEAEGMKPEFISNQPLQFGKGEEMFQGLNMKEALDAHMAWTKRIEKLLSDEEAGGYPIAKVSADHNCVLGGWIHNEAKHKFGEMQEYDELRKVHADFHLHVGGILNDVVNGNHANAEKGVKEIRHHSGLVQLALIRLYAAAQEN